MKKLVSILKGITYTILTLIIIINLLIILTQKLGNKGYPLIFGYTYFLVQTGSMEPTINAGDIIIVELTNEVDVNDIVTYKEEGYFVTHRIIEETSEGYITKGDANNTADGIVKQENIIGKVIKVSEFLGKLKITLSSYIVVGIIIIFIILLNLYSSLERRDKNEIKH